VFSLHPSYATWSKEVQGNGLNDDAIQKTNPHCVSSLPGFLDPGGGYRDPLLHQPVYRHEFVQNSALAEL